jgi:pentatricopeptide repeat protein
LNAEDWNFLVSEVGLKSWQSSFEVFRVFAEEEGKKEEEEEEKGNRDDGGECSKGGNVPTTLKIYTSLIRVLSKNGRNEEVKVIMEKMRKEEIAMDATFFNALFRSFSERGEIAEISQGFLQMEALGIKPDRLSYEMVRYNATLLSVFLI